MHECVCQAKLTALLLHLQVMAQVRRQSQAAASASKCRDYSIKQLMRYRQVPGARPFVKARLLRADGNNALQEGDLQRGIVKLAEGAVLFVCLQLYVLLLLL
jgi:hypothetical protein